MTTLYQSPVETQRMADGFVNLLRPMLTHLGQTLDLGHLEVGAFEDDCIEVRLPGLGITVGYAVEVKTLDGPQLRTGYRVYYIKTHPGTRWDPPEEEDVTVYLGINPREALAAVGNLYVKEAVRYAQDSLNPEY